MKRGLLALLIVLLCLPVIVEISPTPAFAQTAPTPIPEPDRDGDGVPDNRDACPSEPGPASNRGCPLPDSDGDGVPDETDQCPSQPGPASNNGCPLPAQSPDQPPPPPPQQPSPTPQIVLPALPGDGPCVIATQGTQRVNLRREPSTLDPDNIIDLLQPTESGRQAYLKYELKNVQITSYSVSGSGDAAGHEKEIEILSWSWGETQSELTETWFLVDSPAGPAWASGGVIRQGGDCDTLPAVHSSNNLKQIGIALHSINYNWGVLEGWSPDLGVDENGLPFVQCDATLQQIIACDDSLLTQDGLSNTIFLGETSDTDTNGVVDAADYLVWRKNLGGLGEFAILPPDSEEIALLVPAVQAAREAAKRVETEFGLLTLQGGFDSLPAFSGISSFLVLFDSAADDGSIPTETLSLNFDKIQFSDDDMDLANIFVMLNQPGSNPGPQALMIFGTTPSGEVKMQTTILLIPFIDEQGILHDVLVHFFGPEDSSSAASGDADPDILIGGTGADILIGSPADPNMNGLVVIVGASPDNAGANEKWIHDSIAVWW